MTANNPKKRGKKLTPKKKLLLLKELNAIKKMVQAEEAKLAVIVIKKCK